MLLLKKLKVLHKFLFVVCSQSLIFSTTNVKYYPSKMVDQLTRREQEVTELLADGLTNQQIASNLNLSIGSVKAYVQAAFEKTHVSNRVQLAKWWWLKQQTKV